MKSAAFFLLAITMAFCAAGPSVRGAVPLLPGLYDTGVLSDGSLAPIGTTDSHYGWIASDPNSVWTPNTADAQWITPNGNANVGYPVGTWPLSLTFDIGTYSPATLQITGLWAADNVVTVLLNGVDTGNLDNSFGSLSSFTISGPFHSGSNTLTFQVENTGALGSINPTGLIVEWQTLAVVVPEPSTVAFLISCLLGYIVYRLRRSVTRLRGA